MSSRPMYETAADLARERAVASAAAMVWDATPRKLPITYGLDFDGDALEVDFAGRADRGDWQDGEPCAMIPLRDFKRLS